MIIDNESFNDLIEQQLAIWPLAKLNYDALAKTERRKVALGNFEMAVQCNPSRIVSTGAKTDKESIAGRPCFLCRANRPKEQITTEILPGWELLVNPYPILPVHFTIASTTHKPQESVPFDIVELAESLPGMAVFFNGARAGASAPDHLHLQAVLKDELPLLRLVEQLHPAIEPGIKTSSDFDVRLPYFIVSGVVAPDDSGMSALAAGIFTGGLDRDLHLTDRELVNTFFWVGGDRLLRYVVVPRRAHRPSCYFCEGDEKRIVSPGCIDMAGLMIVPRPEDYQRLSATDIMQIYSEVALADYK